MGCSSSLTRETPTKRIKVTESKDERCYSLPKFEKQSCSFEGQGLNKEEMRSVCSGNPFHIDVNQTSPTNPKNPFFKAESFNFSQEQYKGISSETVKSYSKYQIIQDQNQFQTPNLNRKLTPTESINPIQCERNLNNNKNSNLNSNSKLKLKSNEKISTNDIINPVLNNENNVEQNECKDLINNMKENENEIECNDCDENDVFSDNSVLKSYIKTNKNNDEHEVEDEAEIKDFLGELNEIKRSHKRNFDQGLTEIKSNKVLMRSAYSMSDILKEDNASELNLKLENNCYQNTNKITSNEEELNVSTLFSNNIHNQTQNKMDLSLINNRITDNLNNTFFETNNKIEPSNNIATVIASKFESMYSIWVEKDVPIEFKISGVWTKSLDKPYVDFKGYSNKNESEKKGKHVEIIKEGSISNKKINLNISYQDMNLDTEKKNTSEDIKNNVDDVINPISILDLKVNDTTKEESTELLTDGELLCRVFGDKYFSIKNNLSYTPNISGPLFFKMYLLPSNDNDKKECINPKGQLIVQVSNSMKYCFNTINEKLGWNLNELDTSQYVSNLVIGSVEKQILIMINKLRQNPLLFAEQYLESLNDLGPVTKKLYNIIKKSKAGLKPLQINKQLFYFLKDQNNKDQALVEPKVKEYLKNFAYVRYFSLDNLENNSLSILIKLLLYDNVRSSIFSEESSIFSVVVCSYSKNNQTNNYSNQKFSSIINKKHLSSTTISKSQSSCISKQDESSNSNNNNCNNDKNIVEYNKNLTSYNSPAKKNNNLLDSFRIHLVFCGQYISSNELMKIEDIDK